MIKEIHQATITKDDFLGINLNKILKDAKYFDNYSFKFADLREEKTRKRNLKASKIFSLG